MNRSMELEYDYEYEGEYIRRYDSGNFWASRYHNERKKIVGEILRSLFEDLEYFTFLDVGCGSGEYLAFVDDYARNIVGLDISSSYLKRAKENGSINLVRGDIQFMPFKDVEFDISLCSEVIEHAKSFDESLDELLRVTKGYVVITTPNNGILRKIFKKILPQKMREMDRSVGHRWIFSLDEICKKINENYWEIKEKRTLHIMPELLNHFKIPAFFFPLVTAFEILMNLLMLNSGNISMIVLKRLNAKDGEDR